MPGTALPNPALVTGLAFALAFVFGAVAHRVELLHDGIDHRHRELRRLAADADVAAGDRRRDRRHGAAAGGRARSTLAKTIYTGAQVPWLSHLVGGFLFGFGMTLALRLRQQDADPRRAPAT